MENIVQVKNLVKKFGNVKAVDGISLAIKKGSCFGLLGQNGAGKTTTVEIIEGITSATSGTVLYKNMPPQESFREEVGIMFQHTELLSFLTVKETLVTFKSLYQRTADLNYIIDVCQLSTILDKANDKISGGQKQRLLLAIALVNDPDLIFLDEPSTGLDPQARQHLWEIIKTSRSMGKTIILTTHYMEEAEKLCDEIAIMDYGKIIAQGTPDELVKKYCKKAAVTIPLSEFNSRAQSTSCTYRERNKNVELETDDINTCLNELILSGADLTRMHIRLPNLENVFLNLTGRHLRN